MKRTVIVEIDVPENFDDLWDADESGLQAFHDTVTNFAMAHTLKALSNATEHCKKYNITNPKKDAFQQHVLTEIDVINSIKTTGYIDEDDVIHMKYNEGWCKHKLQGFIEE